MKITTTIPKFTPIHIELETVEDVLMLLETFNKCNKYHHLSKEECEVIDKLTIIMENRGYNV